MRGAEARFCHVTKPLTDFHRNRSKKHGISSTCKPCAIARTLAWQKANPDRVNRKNRQSRQRKYGTRLAVITQEQTEARRQRALTMSIRRHKDPDATRRKDRELRAADPEKARQRERLLYRKNSVRMRFNAIGKSARRLYRQQHATLNDLTFEQWQAIKEHYDHRCVYCRRKMKRLTMDHIVPLVKGGNHTLHNVVPACQSCNSRKGTGPPLRPVQPMLIV